MDAETGRFGLIAATSNHVDFLPSRSALGDFLTSIKIINIMINKKSVYLCVSGQI